MSSNTIRSYFGGVIGLGIGIKDEDEEKIQMLLDSLRPAIVGLIESRNYEVPDILNKTDYAIIKELIKKPRMEDESLKDNFILSQNY